tara:strand:+ start:51 stop:428 length:378 start_codon:yes stop_codon:yes gene_type:complete
MINRTQEKKLHQKIFVKNLEVECMVGVKIHEKKIKQKVIISSFLKVDHIEHKDEIKNVISYESVVNIIREITSKKHFNLVESIAENIASSCLQLTGCLEAEVIVEKTEVLKGKATVGVIVKQKNK